MWSSGDVVAMRNVWYGRVRGASPGYVVEDSASHLVVWIPLGAADKEPQPRGVPTEWQLVDAAWIDAGVVVHHWGTRWIATHVRPPAAAPWWYVDVADSITRSSVGVDYRDLLLDVATRDGLQVLDEDELAEAVQLGVLTPREAQEVENVGKDVVAMIDQGAPPFDGEWDAWEPPAEWAVPELPEGWDVV